MPRAGDNIFFFSLALVTRQTQDSERSAGRPARTGLSARPRFRVYEPGKSLTSRGRSLPRLHRHTVKVRCAGGTLRIRMALRVSLSARQMDDEGGEGTGRWKAIGGFDLGVQS